MSFAGIPVAIGFAVLKYRLHDIDVIVNRTLVYGSLTLSLVALYVGSVVSLQSVLRLLTGQDTQLGFPARLPVAETLVRNWPGGRGTVATHFRWLVHRWWIG